MSFKLRINKHARVVQRDDGKFDLEFRGDGSPWRKEYLGFSRLRDALMQYCKTDSGKASQLIRNLLRE